MLVIPPAASIASAVAFVITAVLSFLADFLPVLKGWWGSHSPAWQANVSLVISIIVGILMFIASNTTTLGSATWQEVLTAALMLLFNVVTAVYGGQITKTFVNDPILSGQKSTS